MNAPTESLLPYNLLAARLLSSVSFDGGPGAERCPSREQEGTSTVFSSLNLEERENSSTS